MKKVISITIGAFIILFTGSFVVHAASEVSGTISTQQGGSNNGDPTPTPTPTPPANPDPADDESDDEDDTSSEVSGSVGNGNVAGDTGGSTGSASNNNLSGSVASGGTTRGEDNIIWDARWHGQYLAATTTATTTSENLFAPLADLNFGPRFGAGGGTSLTPGPPDAGARDMSQLSFRRDDAGNLTNDDETLFNFPPSSTLGTRYGEGPVTGAEDLAATALISGNGLTVPQLLVIALVGLAILASMGYAVSRAGRRA